jgi:hypothetical protein
MTPRRDKITDLAIIPERAEHQHFEEELTILAIARTRIFRQAIQQDIHLPDMPHIEGEVLAELFELADDGYEDELDDVRAELDQAAQGQDPVTAEILKWRQELETTHA